MLRTFRSTELFWHVLLLSYLLDYDRVEGDPFYMSLRYASG